MNSGRIQPRQCKKKNALLSYEKDFHETSYTFLCIQGIPAKLAFDVTSR